MADEKVEVFVIVYSVRIMNLCAVYRTAVNITPRILNLVQLYEVYEVLRDDSVPRCRSSS